MTEKDWIQVAMTEDSIAAETLLLLHQAETIPSKSGGATTIKLEWSLRQKRTKTAAARKNGSDHTSGSPNTPLSWSGVNSVSGGADGFEESSHAVKSFDGFRSKIPINSGAPCKKSTRKKTITELKEDEDLLLKERSCLKNELASMRLMFQNQKARNQILKKTKVDLIRTGIPESKRSAFWLPDLNQPPLDNYSNPEFLH